MFKNLIFLEENLRHLFSATNFLPNFSFTRFLYKLKHLHFQYNPTEDEMKKIIKQNFQVY